MRIGVKSSRSLLGLGGMIEPVEKRRDGMSGETSQVQHPRLSPHHRRHGSNGPHYPLSRQIHSSSIFIRFAYSCPILSHTFELCGVSPRTSTSKPRSDSELLHVLRQYSRTVGHHFGHRSPRFCTPLWRNKLELGKTAKGVPSRRGSTSFLT